MHQHPADEARAWVTQAESDLDDARYNFEGRRYNVACFLAQQAAEKALKGVLVWKAGDRARVHLIDTLLRELAPHDMELTERLGETRMLDKYYTSARYPDAIGGAVPSASFHEQEAVLALDVANRCVQAIQEAIPR